ncbi:hypothetical protein SMATCC274_07870 [Serratia marcescens]|nr:hypothetical protein SMATCC274_07870 [Serratia marcescens]
MAIEAAGGMAYNPAVSVVIWLQAVNTSIVTQITERGESRECALPHIFTARKFMLGVPSCALPGNPGIVRTRLWGRADV